VIAERGSKVPLSPLFFSRSAFLGYDGDLLRSFFSPLTWQEWVQYAQVILPPLPLMLVWSPLPLSFFFPLYFKREVVPPLPLCRPSNTLTRFPFLFFPPSFNAKRGFFPFSFLPPVNGQVNWRCDRLAGPLHSRKETSSFLSKNRAYRADDLHYLSSYISSFSIFFCYEGMITFPLPFPLQPRLWRPSFAPRGIFWGSPFFFTYSLDPNQN